MKKILNNKKILIIIGILLGVIGLSIVGHFGYRYYTDLKRDKYADEHEKKDNLGIVECKYFDKDEDKMLSCTIKNTITNFDFFRLSFDVQTSDDVEYIDYDVFSDEWYISINNSNKNSMKVYTSIDYNFVQGNLKNDIPEYITLNFKINNISKDSVMIFKNLEFLDNDSILHKNENDIIINLIDYTKNNNQEKTAKEFSNSIIDIQKYITLNKQDNNYSNYTIDLNTAFKDNKLNGLSILEEYNIVFKYKLNDCEIQLKLNDNDDLDAYAYGVYINDKHIYYDYALSWNKIEVDMLGKYFLFRYNGCTDIRCPSYILADNTGNVTFLNELDNISGLIATLPTVSNEGITLKATRITHNGAIVYGGKTYQVYRNDECKNTSSILPKDLLIQATYTYKFNDGVLNLTPEITNKITLDEYLKDENNCN